MAIGSEPHSHEQWNHPGRFHNRARAMRNRDFSGRTFTVGVGGPVGSGKTALMLALCRRLGAETSVGAVTNDIFTREDAEFLMRHRDAVAGDFVRPERRDLLAKVTDVLGDLDELVDHRGGRTLGSRLPRLACEQHRTLTPQDGGGRRRRYARPAPVRSPAADGP